MRSWVALAVMLAAGAYLLVLLVFSGVTDTNHETGESVVIKRQ